MNRNVVVVLSLVTGLAVGAAGCAPEAPERVAAGLGGVTTDPNRDGIAPSPEPGPAGASVTSSAAPSRTDAAVPGAVAPVTREPGDRSSTAGGAPRGSASTSLVAPNPDRPGTTVIYDRGISIRPQFTPTRPDKRPGGAEMPVIAIQQQLSAGAPTGLALTSESTVVLSSVTLRFSAKDVSSAKSLASDCAVKGREFVCDLGAMKPGARVSVDITGVASSKAAVGFVIEATTPDDVVYTGAFEAPLIAG